MKQEYVKLCLFYELSGHEGMHIIIQYIFPSHNDASCPGFHELKSQCLKKCRYSWNKAHLPMQKNLTKQGVQLHATSRNQPLTHHLHRNQDQRWIIYAMKTQTFWLQTGLEFCEHILLLLPTCQIFGVNNFQPQWKLLLTNCSLFCLGFVLGFFFFPWECCLLLLFNWISNFVNKKIKIANSKCCNNAYFCWRYSREGP